MQNPPGMADQGQHRGAGAVSRHHGRRLPPGCVAQDLSSFIRTRRGMRGRLVSSSHSRPAFTRTRRTRVATSEEQADRTFCGELRLAAVAEAGAYAPEHGLALVERLSQSSLTEMLGVVGALLIAWSREPGLSAVPLALSPGVDLLRLGSSAGSVSGNDASAAVVVLGSVIVPPSSPNCPSRDLLLLGGASVRLRPRDGHPRLKSSVARFGDRQAEAVEACRVTKTATSPLASNATPATQRMCQKAAATPRTARPWPTTLVIDTTRRPVRR